MNSFWQLDQIMVTWFMVQDLDSVPSSHPISVDVNNPDEINEIFSGITYGKVRHLISIKLHRSVQERQMASKGRIDNTNDELLPRRFDLQQGTDRKLLARRDSHSHPGYAYSYISSCSRIRTRRTRVRIGIWVRVRVLLLVRLALEESGS